MKVVVQQIGSRMDYAVPRALHTEGYLERLVTDLYFVNPPALSKLRGYSAGLPLSVISRDIPSGLLYRILLSRIEMRIWPHLWAAETIAARTCKAARDADVVYGFDTALLPAMDRLRRQGTMIVMEQCIAPRSIFRSSVESLSDKLLEAGINPADSGLMDGQAYYDIMSAIEQEEWSKADRIYCAAPFVRDGLVAEGVDPGKIRVVPYGISLPENLAPRDRASTGQPRVVFGGAFSWRKGALEFGRLAMALKGAARFEAFGKPQIPAEIAHRIGANIAQNGHVPKRQFLASLRNADIFVLPSHMEGSATVIYEAMALGLPCVVSVACGSVISHGKDGFVFEVGDEDALRSAVETLLANPELRREIGQRAAATAGRFTRESYGSRIVAALREDYSAHRAAA